MRIAMVCTPMTEPNLKMARQVGVTDIVGRFPGEKQEEVAALRDRVAERGMKLSVIEGYLPIDQIILATPKRDEQIARMATLIRSMGKLGIGVLCYNFMPCNDWSRTTFHAVERGGALTSAFDAEAEAGKPQHAMAPTTPQWMWDNLAYFLKRIIPVAEEAGVTLAMHPDDPPMPTLRGMAQIMYSPACFDRLLELSPSPAHAMCFCQGSFAQMGVDIPSAIRHFGKRIGYVHFRDVRGTMPRFTETFHDNGKTDMADAMRAYHAIGYTGVMRPDHVPKLEIEEGDGSGYTMLGRLFAVGYMRGLMHAVLGKNSGETPVESY
ncbi:MAG: mannonate dehydratase [Planctomycetes bacterium]|nr:mannonate dehydratase [Planctomycetota bacterium]